MVGNTPTPFGLSLNDIQNHLTRTIGQWMSFTDGKVSVRVTDLAKVVHEIGLDIAERRINHEIAQRYDHLASAMRRSNTTNMPPEAADALDRWATSIGRRAEALRSLGRRGGEQR